MSELDMNKFDDDMDFGFGSVDNGTRKPVDAFIGNTTAASKEASKKTAKIVGSHILESMPNTGSLASDVSAAGSEFAEITDDVKEQINKSIRSTKKITRATLPKLKRYMPAKVYDKLMEATKLEEEAAAKRKSEMEQAQDAATGLVSEMFQNKAAFDLEKFKEESLSRLVDSAKREVVDRNKLTLLAGIGAKVGFTATFTDQVTRPWMKKSLEISYLQLFVAKQHLNVAKITMEMMDVKLGAIAKNTALPDVVKMRSAEFVTESYKRKFADNAPRTVAAYAMKIKDLYVKNVKSNMEQMYGMVDMAADMSSMAGDMGMGDDQNATGTAAGGIIGSLLGKTLSRVLLEPMRPITRIIDRQSKNMINTIKTGGRNIRDSLVASNIPMLQTLGQLMPVTTAHATIGNDLLTEGFEATPFDKLTRQSIVEIIPRWLSMIAKNTRDLVTGEDTALETYNVVTRQMSTVSEAKKSYIDYRMGTTDVRSEGIKLAMGYVKGGMDDLEGVTEDDYEVLKPDLMKMIDNAIAHELTLSPAVFKKLQYIESLKEIENPNVKHLIKGVKNPIATIRLMARLIFSESGGRINEDFVSMINGAIGQEAGKRSFKQNLASDIEGYGMRSLFSDEIKDGVFTAEALSSLRMDITDEALAKGEEAGASRLATERNISQKDMEAIRTSRIMSALNPYTNKTAGKLADKDIPLASELARMFESNQGELTDEQRAAFARGEFDGNVSVERDKVGLYGLSEMYDRTLYNTSDKDNSPVNQATRGKLKHKLGSVSVDTSDLEDVITKLSNASTTILQASKTCLDRIADTLSGQSENVEMLVDHVTSPSSGGGNDYSGIDSMHQTLRAFHESSQLQGNYIFEGVMLIEQHLAGMRAFAGDKDAKSGATGIIGRAKKGFGAAASFMKQKGKLGLKGLRSAGGMALGLLSGFSSRAKNFSKGIFNKEKLKDRWNSLRDRFSRGDKKDKADDKTFKGRFTKALTSIQGMFKKEGFVDVYLKGEVIPGRPLASAKDLENYGVYIDGGKVKSSWEIRKPVANSKTGNMLITEENIKHGLVDVNGKKIGSKLQLNLSGLKDKALKWIGKKSLKLLGFVPKLMFKGMKSMAKEAYEKAKAGAIGLYGKVKDKFKDTKFGELAGKLKDKFKNSRVGKMFGKKSSPEAAATTEGTSSIVKELKRIYKFMNDTWGKSTTDWFDRDGKKKRKPTSKNTKSKSKRKGKLGKRKSKMPGGLKNKLSGVGSKLKGVGSSIAGAAGTAGGFLTGGLGLSGLLGSSMSGIAAAGGGAMLGAGAAIAGAGALGYGTGRLLDNTFGISDKVGDAAGNRKQRKLDKKWAKEQLPFTLAKSPRVAKKFAELGGNDVKEPAEKRVIFDKAMEALQAENAAKREKAKNTKTGSVATVDAEVALRNPELAMVGDDSATNGVVKQVDKRTANVEAIKQETKTIEDTSSSDIISGIEQTNELLTSILESYPLMIQALKDVGANTSKLKDINDNIVSGNEQPREPVIVQQPVPAEGPRRVVTPTIRVDKNKLHG